MGREIKRVAAGFDWPLGERWEGFVNPHFRPCPETEKTCFGGQTAAGRWFDAICGFLSTVGEGCLEYPRAAEMRARGMNAPHPYLTEFPQAPHFGVPPDVTAEADKLEGESRRRFVLGHSYAHPPAILPLTEELLGLLGKFAGVGREAFFAGGRAAYAFEKAIAKAAGIDLETFGRCPVCGGEGMDPEAAAAYEAWEKTEPPAGDWWQVWETVSEGSPVTPAFATAEWLIDYLTANGDAWDQRRGDGGWKREAAESFIKAGWAPTLVTVVGGKFESYAPRDGVPTGNKEG